MWLYMTACDPEKFSTRDTSVKIIDHVNFPIPDTFP